ncbi:MAG: RNA polymerase sigma factor [Actinomycetota bacterium]|nr:RNA polymerase sigma factor [Actinomycetota bacterium]
MTLFIEVCGLVIPAAGGVLAQIGWFNTVLSEVRRESEKRGPRLYEISIKRQQTPPFAKQHSVIFMINSPLTLIKKYNMKYPHNVDRKLKFIDMAIEPALRLLRFAQSLNSVSDEGLAAKAAAGSANHFEALVQRYSSAMFRLAFRLSGSRGDAEDIVQETFIKLWRALPAADTDLPFKPWLYKIAVNTSLSHLRKKNRGQTVDLDATDNLIQLGDFAGVSTDNIDAQTAIDRLPLDYRRIFLLRAVEDLAFADIADILDIPEATARTRFKRAKDQLRQYLSK